MAANNNGSVNPANLGRLNPSENRKLRTWRFWAKAAAFLDITISLIFMVLEVVFLIIASVMVAAVEQVLQDERYQDQNVDYTIRTDTRVTSSVTILWVIVIIHLIVMGILIWADVRLIGAAKNRIETEQAVKRCKIFMWTNILYLIVNWVFTIIQVVGGNGTVVMALISTIFRVVLIAIVYKFMTVVKEAGTEVQKMDQAGAGPTVMYPVQVRGLMPTGDEEAHKIPYNNNKEKMGMGVGGMENFCNNNNQNGIHITDVV